MRFKWAALASGWAALALVVIAPGADSAPNPGLKLKSVIDENTNPGTFETVRPKCPDGWDAIAGGFDVSSQYTPDALAKTGGRKFVVEAREDGARAARRGALVLGQVICAKGTGGLTIEGDDGGLPGP